MPTRLAPFGAVVVALLAIADQLWNRLLVRVVADRELSGLSHDAIATAGQAGDLLRNTCALLGVLTLGLAITEMIQPRHEAPLHQRLGLAGFAGIFLPTVLLAAVLPAERTTPLVVLFALGAVNLLAILLSTSAGRKGATFEMRSAMVGAALGSFLAFAATIFLLIGALTLWQHAHPLGTALHHGGELLWGVALVSLGVVGWPRERALWQQLSLGAGVVALMVFAAVGGSWLDHAMENEAFSSLAYGLLHGQLLLKVAPALYLTLHALVLGVGLSGLAAKSPLRRQASLGLLFLLASGIAPTTPLTLLMLALALTLVWRALVAQSLIEWLVRAGQDDLLALDAELDAETP